MVRTVFHGPYEGLGAAWQEFGKWTEGNGCKTAGDLYECYLAGPEASADSANWRTELSRPVIE
jgi:effector-binding domain-containing protein